MRIAIASDIHGNRTAFEAVLADLRKTSPDLTLDDGDRRAAYLLLDESKPAIRRVEYDVDKELKALSACRLPHADWVAKILESG